MAISRRSYLECYTMEAIDEVDAKIDALPRGSMQRKMLQRLFHGQSFPTTVDETGRLVLPAKLRNKIDLEDEAFFIAAGDTFQIWKPETYETEERPRRGMAGRAARGFRSDGLPGRQAGG